ncbi:hypothetical protein WA026_021774 [Henosepilachna vigintioctopunctata]|uniref:Uncharacterized protein n=1 Tax=Henosepilachna vigintioctopunctata TaxID=420089 RepID=A0AAW1TXG8_9CUCU
MGFVSVDPHPDEVCCASEQPTDEFTALQKMAKIKELEMDLRKDAIVPDENLYVFGLPEKERENHIEACPLLRKHSEKCGAKNPHLLRGTKLRKHISIKSVMLNSNDQEVSDLANYMGHNENKSVQHTNEELPSESSDIADLLAESSDEYVLSSESSSEVEQQTPAKILNNEGRKRKDEGEASRKHKINPSNWKENVSKQRKLQGKEYVTLKGKLIKAKRKKTPCNCRKKCFDLMSNEEREIIF